MTFNSLDALKNYILSRSKVAVKLAEERVYDVIAKFLFQFYEEFDPQFYVRTYQLLCSLVKTEVKPIKNGWVAEVYFDLDALDYSTRIVPIQFSFASGDNTYHRNNWTHANDEWVLQTAMKGRYPHGDYPTVNKTRIWIESMKVLNKEKRRMLKQALIDAGIPVR